MKRVILVGVVAVFLSSTVMAWTVFNDGDDNYCAQCHVGNVIMAAHDTSNCLACHTAAPGDVPVTSNCAVCHDAVVMINFHNDAGILSCADCHAGVPNEPLSWSELRERWQR